MHSVLVRLHRRAWVLLVSGVWPRSATRWRLRTLDCGLFCVASFGNGTLWLTLPLAFLYIRMWIWVSLLITTRRLMESGDQTRINRCVCCVALNLCYMFLVLHVPARCVNGMHRFEALIRVKGTVCVTNKLQIRFLLFLAENFGDETGYCKEHKPARSNI